MKLINEKEMYGTSMDRDTAAEWLYGEAVKEAQRRPGIITDDFDSAEVIESLTDALSWLDAAANNPNNRGYFRTLRDVLWIITDDMA